LRVPPLTLLLCLAAAVAWPAGRSVRADDPGLFQAADPADTDAGALDILGAGVRAVGSDSLQFDMRFREPVPVDPGRSTGITYLWLVDTDRNGATGQPHGPVGSEYNVRVAYNQGIWEGWVDAILPGTGVPGQPAVFVQGNRVSIRLARAQLGQAGRFTWGVESFVSQPGRPIAGDHSETPVETSLPSGLAERGVDLQIAPATLLLQGGRTRIAPRILTFSETGSGTPAAGTSTRFFVNRPSLARAEGSDVVALPGRFGSASVTALVDGVVTRAAGLNVGSIEMSPPAIHPLPNSRTKVTVSLRDAQGMPVSVNGKSVVFSTSDPAVASVSPVGEVTALKARRAATISATVDGVGATNNCYASVLDSGFAMPAMRRFDGKHVSFYLPADVPGSNHPETIGQMMEKYGCLMLTDASYELERELTGCTPFGGRQYLTAAGGVDQKSTVFGVSGNPLLLGFELYGRGSAIQQHNGEPHWGHVWLHELGHNFTLASMPFNQAFGPGEKNLPSSVTYIEGLATVVGLYALEKIAAHPERYGLTDAARGSLQNPATYGSVPQNRTRFLGALRKYEQSGADYARLDADVLDGMFLLLADQYGWDPLSRFFDILLPVTDTLPFPFDTEAQRATFLVAGLAAAYRTDLRALFSGRWHFPVDEALYSRMLPILASRSERGRALR
jgi:hypothetical protein